MRSVLLPPCILGSSAMTSTTAFTFPSSPLPKLVMLDRDGVINQDVGAPGVINKEQFQLTPNAANAIGSLKRSGCQVVVITNQSCVGKGLLARSALDEIHDTMQLLLVEVDSCATIDHIYVCTTSSVDNSDPRKKPNPGMIIEACRDLGVQPADAIFIGDTLTDMQAAKSGGVQTRVLVETGYGYGLMDNTSACVPGRVVERIDEDANVLSRQMDEVTPFLYASNLAEAVKSFLG